MQTIRVKWGQYLSLPFNVTNGVKQGGVHSPILFGIYIDELLKRMKSSGLGCYIGHVFIGSLAYADDVSLLSPTRYALTKMLEIANSFSRDFNITVAKLNLCFLVRIKNQ